MPRQGMSPGRIGLFVSLLMLGVGIGLVLLDRVFVWIPTDIQRLGYVYRTLGESGSNPQIVVFGNSVVMSGIDARALSQTLDDEPLAWNLATTGQTTSEAFLLTQSLPASVEIAIYGLSISAGPATDYLHPQKYNTLYMYGFRPTSGTVETLDRFGDPATIALLEKSRLAQIFASRWALRQFVDTQIRASLRKDLALDKAAVDLFHPQSYSRRIDLAIRDRLLATRLRGLEAASFAAVAAPLGLARQISVDAGERGRRVVFLVSPAHPKLLAAHGEAMREAVATFEAELARVDDARIVSALEVLDAEHFIDDVHPTNEGAAILSRFLGRALGEGH